MPLTDKKGNLLDKKVRDVNAKGYLVDNKGNIIDMDGRQIFEKKHLENQEIPKIFPFTRFNIKNIIGDFEMDPKGKPVLKKQKGNLLDK